MKLPSLPGLGLSMNTCALHYMVIMAFRETKAGGGGQGKEQRKIIDRHGAFFSTSKTCMPCKKTFFG